jgi:hypothetical protein
MWRVNNTMSIAVIVLSTCLFSVSVAYLTLAYNFNKVRGQYQQLFIDMMLLEKLINEIEDSKINSDESVHKENFIKFISDSRDWAYQYIEDVQAGLKHFIDETAPEIQYFRDYSDTMALAPNYYSMKKISEEYDKLKELLPSDEEVK